MGFTKKGTAKIGSYVMGSNRRWEISSNVRSTFIVRDRFASLYPHTKQKRIAIAKKFGLKYGLVITKLH